MDKDITAVKKGCGIICEYNPFHNGHAYQIKYVKNVLKLPVICAMSGDFVQRGDCACMDKNTRASSAVKGGAEVVLEIPFPYSSMTAEKFAEAGISVLDGCGMCSHIAFGSECADVEKLKKIAFFLLDDETIKSIQVYQSTNPSTGFASARNAVIRKALGDELADISESPNDILAIEYIKAIIRSGSNLIPIAVKRTINRADKAAQSFASSSHIRELAGKGELAGMSEFMPDAEDFISRYKGSEHLHRMIHVFLMTRTPEELSVICEIGGGTEYSIVKAAQSSQNYDEMFSKLKSKTLTDAKIRRMLLFAFMGVTKETAASPLEGTSVLAMADTNTAKELMRICRKEKKIVVAQRASAFSANESARRQFEFSLNAGKVLKCINKSI